MQKIGDRLAPTLGGRLDSHAHYLKEGGIWKKYVGLIKMGLMSLNWNYRWCYITFFIVTNPTQRYDIMYSNGEIIISSKLSGVG